MRTVRTLTLLAVLAAPAAAQSHEGHQMGQPPAGQQGGMMQGGMMGGQLPGPVRRYGGLAPAKVLEMKAMLGLSAEQETAITALAASSKQAGDDAHAPAMAAMRSLREEMAKPAPDKAAIRQYLVAHATAEGNMQWAELDAAMQVEALLTPAQRKHVEEMGSGGHQAGSGRPQP